MSAFGVASLIPIPSGTAAAATRPVLTLRQPKEGLESSEFLFLGRNGTTRILEPRMSRRIAQIQWTRNGTKSDLSIQALGGVQGSVYVNKTKISGINSNNVSQRVILKNGDTISLRSPEDSAAYDYRVNLVDMIPPGDSQQSQESDARPGLDVAQEFSCAICLDIMVEPVSVVPCGHSFCRCCLQSSVRECPECRTSLKGKPVPARSLDHAISLLVEGQAELFSADDIQQYHFRSKQSGTKRPAYNNKTPQRRLKRSKVPASSSSLGMTAADAIVID